MLLFVNACLREGSRTDRLARAWLEGHANGCEVEELSLSQVHLTPLDAGGENAIADYRQAVASGMYTHPMFTFAKQFAQADEVLIAAPFWNYGIPAKLHAYLELVCSQGVTFDIGASGEYVSLCRAQRLTFVVTAGGPRPDDADDHAFGYVRTLAQRFWHIPQIDLVAAWGIDAPGANVDQLLAEASM